VELFCALERDLEFLEGRKKEGERSDEWELKREESKLPMSCFAHCLVVPNLAGLLYY
jgi:hypothetical protein